MPFILQNGQLVEITDEEYAAYTTTTTEGTVPAGGEIIQVVDPVYEQIIDPNTTNTSPDQALTYSVETAATEADTTVGVDAFGSQPVAEVDPFAGYPGTDAPAEVDPFGGYPSATEVDPFAGYPGTDAPAEVDPFGGYPSTTEVDPFAGYPGTGSPTSPTEADPFATQAQLDLVPTSSVSTSSNVGVDAFGAGYPTTDVNPFAGYPATTGTAPVSDSSIFSLFSSLSNTLGGLLGGLSSIFSKPGTVGTTTGYAVTEVDPFAGYPGTSSPTSPTEADPFATQAQLDLVPTSSVSTSAAEVDPFGGYPATTEVDPFAGYPGTDAPAEVDPFGGYPTGEVDPFGGYPSESSVATSPSTTDDPFATQADLDAVPLSDVSTSPTEVDPFGGYPTGEVDPFGGMPVEEAPVGVDAFGGDAAGDVVPISDIATESSTDVPTADIIDYPLTDTGEIGAKYQEAYVSPEAEALLAQPETQAAIRETMAAPEPPKIESSAEESQLSLEELEALPENSTATDVPVEQQGDELVSLNDGQVYGIDPETGFVQSGDQPYMDPAEIPVTQQGDELVSLNDGQVYGIDAESGFVQSGDQLYVDPGEIPVTQQGDELVSLNDGQVYGIDPETGFLDSGQGLLVSPEDIQVTQQGDTLVDLNTGQEYAIDPETGFVEVDGLLVAPDEIPVEQQGDQLVSLNDGQVYGIDPETGFVDNGQGLLVSPEDIQVERQGDTLVDLNTGQEYAIDPESGFVEVDGLYVSPEDVANQNNADLPEGAVVEFTAEGDVVRSADEITAQQAGIDAAVQNARSQAILAQQMRQANDGDWRVKLRLAPGSNYLYRANDGRGTQAGILQPLVVTDGVVFPYTPQINTTYKANYSSYDLTHSNYRGYFYQGSHMEEINITATFTAQDSNEAKYLLAVIHFFRSITKMFYGKDSNPIAGMPPPLVFLQGLGQYQFNLHPCLVSQFNYNLPNDVDYIRADSPNIVNTNLLIRRARQTVATNPFESAWQRLTSAGVPKGGINTPPAPPALGTNSPTYVPTKIDIQLVLLPVQSRSQVSNNFSLQSYANGDLLKGGFW